MDRTVNFYYCTALPITRTVLKNQACNIYKHWSYNRKLRVSTVLIYILWRGEKNRHRKSIGGHQVAWWCDHFYQGSLEFPRFDFKKLWTNFSFVNTLLYKMMSNFLLLLCKYSHLFNKRGAWNKRGGGAKVGILLNVELE